MKSLLGKVALILVLVFSIQVLTGTFAMAAQAQTAKLDPLLAHWHLLLSLVWGNFCLVISPELLIMYGLFRDLDSGISPGSYTYGVTAILPLLWAIYSAYDAYQMAQ